MEEKGKRIEKKEDISWSWILLWTLWHSCALPLVHLYSCRSTLGLPASSAMPPHYWTTSWTIHRWDFMLSFHPTFKEQSFKFISAPSLQPAIHARVVNCTNIIMQSSSTQALCLGQLNQSWKFCSITTGFCHMQTKEFIMHLYPIVPVRDIPSLQHHCNKVHVLWNAIWQIVLWDTNGLSRLLSS